MTKIIRVRATECPTCGRRAGAPTRSQNSGCVDAYHDGHVFDLWHTRKEARQIRKDNAVFFGVVWVSTNVENGF